jgi:AcrR family transcriptional regulator
MSSGAAAHGVNTGAAAHGESSPGTARDRLLDRVVEHFAAHGIGDTSLRSLAGAIGSSHRMLHYHFGSREGLLSAVVERVEQAQRDLLQALLAGAPDPAGLGGRYWREVTDAALTYGPLFFELSGQAMQGATHAQALRAGLIDAWLGPLSELWQRSGLPPGAARAHARLGLAVARGLLFDLLITGDRTGVDAAMDLFAELTTAPTAAPTTAPRTASPRTASP